MERKNSDDKFLIMQSPVEVGSLRISFHRGKELRVEGSVLAIVREGSASLTVNAKKIDVEEGMAIFLAFDMTVIPIRDSGIIVDYIALDSVVTGEIFFSITSSSLWDFIYSNPAIVPEKGLSAYLDRLFLQMDWVRRRFPEQISRTVLRNDVQSLFSVLAAVAEGLAPGDRTSKTRAWAISNDFVTMLHRHYARHHDVAFYADALNISSDYLNVICRDNIGYTAKSRIDTQIVIAIKTMLDTTDLPVKIIAERLHYDDPSYMSRVFRRITGMTPVQYRNRHNSV